MASIVRRDAMRAASDRNAPERVQLASRANTENRERGAITAGGIEMPERRCVGDDVDTVAGRCLRDLLAVLGQVEDCRLAFIATDEQQSALLVEGDPA